MGYPYHKYFHFCYLDEEPENEFQMQLHRTKTQWKGKTPDIQDELAMNTPLQKENEEEVYSFLDYHFDWYVSNGGEEEAFFKAIESTWDGSGRFEHEAAGQAFRPALEWVEKRKKKELNKENRPVILNIELNSGNPDLDSRFRNILYLCKTKSVVKAEQLKIVSLIRLAINDHPAFKEYFIDRLKSALKYHLSTSPKPRLLTNSVEKIIYYRLIGAENILLWLETKMPDYEKSDTLPLNEEYEQSKKREKFINALPTDEEHTYENWYAGKIVSELRISGNKKGIETKKILNSKAKAFDLFRKENLICNQVFFAKKFLNAIDREFLIANKIQKLDEKINRNLKIREKVAENDLDSFIWQVKLSDYKRYESFNDNTISCSSLFNKDGGDKNEGFETLCNYDLQFWLKKIKALPEGDRLSFLNNWYSELPQSKKLVIEDHFKEVKKFIESISDLANPQTSSSSFQIKRKQNLDEEALFNMILPDNKAQFIAVEESLIERKFLNENGEWVKGKGALVAFIEVIKERGYTRKRPKSKERKFNLDLRRFFDDRYKVNTENFSGSNKQKRELDKHGIKFFWIEKAKN